MRPEVMAPSLSGAVTTFATIREDQLVVAGTGDVRAILGRKGASGQLEAVALTEEHHTELPKERDRLLSEHPGEQFVIYAGRVLGGLQPTRAFGDGRYKWTVQQMRRLSERMEPIQTKSRAHGAKLQAIEPPPQYFTPPYVTAKPDVVVHRLDSNADQFLILATDGLWDFLSQERAVSLVQEYLEKRASGKLDDRLNCASYLIRNAVEHMPNGPVKDRNGNWISGEQIATQLLAIPPGPSRRYRDDITVAVVFLNGTQQYASLWNTTTPMSVRNSIQTNTWTRDLSQKAKL